MRPTTSSGRLPSVPAATFTWFLTAALTANPVALAADPTTDKATDKAAGETLAITGATVYTLGPQGTLNQATVLIRDGKIVAVGTDLAVPPGARVWPASGKVLTPGLFDSGSPIGLSEISLEPSTRSDATDDPRLTAGFDVALMFNPRSPLIPVNRIEGLTRALIVPQGRTSPIAGRGAVVHLGSSSDYLVRQPAALVVDAGESGATRAGGSRAAVLLRLREALGDARDFAANRRAVDSGARRDYALSRVDLEALLPVAQGQLPVAVEVHRASDIEAVLHLGKELGLRLVILGGTEAWRVAPALAAANVPVVLNPLTTLPQAFEALGATLENAARLNQHGVKIAFMSGESHNGRNLKQAAGNAVAYGLPWLEALKAITVNPAQIWGIDDYGTIEPGKDADLVLWDGDPLEVTTLADQVWIRGVEIKMVSRQTLLRDRYLDLKRPWPPAYTRP